MIHQTLVGIGNHYSIHIATNIAVFIKCNFTHSKSYD